MDAGVATFTGTCVDVDRDFKSGDSVILSLVVSFRRSAFADPNAAPKAVSTSKDGRKTFHDDLKETETEKGMRERKGALNTLFSRVNLTPVVDVDTKGDGVTGQLLGKKEMLDQYEKSTRAGEEEEEKELSEDALAQVCKHKPDRTELFLMVLLTLGGAVQTRRLSRTTPTCPKLSRRTTSRSACDHVSYSAQLGCPGWLN